jgi:hypothetical protein
MLSSPPRLHNAWRSDPGSGLLTEGAVARAGGILADFRVADLLPPTDSVGLLPRWSVDAVEAWLRGPSRRIYFIERPDTGEIKIGVSGQPRRRLADLQTAHGEPLQLLVVFIGDERDECYLHGLFEADRKLGEWFRATDEIRSFANNRVDRMMRGRAEIDRAARELSHARESTGVAGGLS